MSLSTLSWRGTDVEGLERLELGVAPRGIAATSTVICANEGGFRLDHRWQLDGGWRVLSVSVERAGAR